MWAAFLAIFALVVAGVILFLIFRRTQSAPAEPLAEVAEIHKAKEAEREKIKGSTLSGAQVKEMSDDELEKLVNDDTPVPGGK